jgi:diaminopimelate decarboxylase
MHAFETRKGTLFCEQVPVERIAREVGTPTYIYSYRTLTDHFQKLKRAFAPIKPLICFSVKANGNLTLLKILTSQGAGLDIVSGGELFKALRAGCPPERIVFASVGKTPEEIRESLTIGIHCFNVESVPELERINAEACAMKKVAPVALRINPDVDAHTHKHITTGVAESKFGIDFDVARELLLSRWSEFSSLRLVGLHLHIGSQITQSSPFVEAITRVGGLIKELRAAGVRVETINLGGGLGIVYKDEQPQTAQQFADVILPLLKQLDVRLILEPGRFIVGNAGILVTRVLYRNKKKKKQFLVVDAGMNDLIRPALYEAYHDVQPVLMSGHTDAPRETFDVVGPICESADVLARERQLPALEPGELLAVFGAGAYGFVMASNYNGRPRAAEVLVKGNKYFIIRKRETRHDLLRLETIPKEFASA